MQVVGMVASLLMVAGTAAAADGWATIKGRVIWGGAQLPTPEKLDVTKDQEHCLKNGPIFKQNLVVDPESKGIRDIFVYVKKPSAIHPDLPQDAAGVAKKFEAEFEAATKLKFDPEVLQPALADAAKRGEVVAAMRKAGLPVIDQVSCTYKPHAVAAREGQKTLVLNYEPVAHNVKVTSVSGKNDANPNMPPQTITIFEWASDTSPMAIQCAIHPWMEMFGMAFDHPYYAVTREDGSFEIKNVPAGEVTLVMRNPRYIDPLTGGKGTARGATLTLSPGETKDLGEIKYNAE